jgi:hypothetical protein
VLGVICVDTLGADAGVFAEYEQNLARGMTDDEIGFVRDTQARRRAGDVTEADLVEVLTARASRRWPTRRTFRGSSSRRRSDALLSLFWQSSPQEPRATGVCSSGLRVPEGQTAPSLP